VQPGGRRGDGEGKGSDPVVRQGIAKVLDPRVRRSRGHCVEQGGRGNDDAAVASGARAALQPVEQSVEHRPGITIHLDDDGVEPGLAIETGQSGIDRSDFGDAIAERGGGALDALGGRFPVGQNQQARLRAILVFGLGFRSPHPS
jgi:hypothetical protein